MAVDDELTKRFAQACQGLPALSQKKMMGGVCFFVQGNMLGGADRTKDGLGRFMFRVGKGAMTKALQREGAAPMIMGGRTMGGMIFVDEAACDAVALSDWIALAFEFVGALPPK